DAAAERRALADVPDRHARHLGRPLDRPDRPHGRRNDRRRGNPGGEVTMVARVTLAEIDVVRRSPARGIEVFEESVIPALAQEEGYLGCYLLLSNEGKLAVLSFSTDEEAADAARASGFYEQQIGKFAELAIFKSKPGRDSYDVIV